MRPVPLIACGVCALVLVGLYVGFSYIPDQHRIADSAHIARAVNKEVDRLQAVSGGVPGIREQLKTVEANWLAAAGFLQPRDSVTDFVSWFRNAPGRNGLNGTWEFGSADTLDCYQVMTFRLRVTGSNSAFRRMLAQWEGRPRGWGVSQMTVFWEDSGIIRATITGALYLQSLD